MKDYSNENSWSITDLGLCAALKSVGFELIQLDKTDQRRVKFLFARTPELEKAATDYWADALRVNPREYFDNLKLIKNRLYGEG